LKKSSGVKLYENPFSGSRAVLFGGRAGRQKDGLDEANSRFSQFLESAYDSFSVELYWILFNAYGCICVAIFWRIAASGVALNRGLKIIK
jgi:hypothetical protein